MIYSSLEALRALRRVLVVSKRTRWEFASTRFGGLHGQELEDLLRERGFPYQRIVQAHHAHHDALDQITRSLSRRGIEVRVVRAPALIASDLEGVDAVFTAGGDGTVLETAARIKYGNVPVVTINTDPQLSTGFLCSFHLKKGATFDVGVLDKLKKGKFQPNPRTRIQVRFGASTISPHFALNEVFYAERDASRPTVHETTLGSMEDKGVVQRSSGVIISTGTGSTAWMSSASMIHRWDIKRVVDSLNNHITDQSKKIEYDKDLIDKICEEVNGDCVYSPNSEKLQYCMRELVLNGWYGKHDNPLTSFPKRGFESQIKIRSLAWDGLLTFDGIETQRVPYGETMHISAAPPKNSLLTIALEDDDSSS